MSDDYQFPAGSVPYFIDGRRVTRYEYVERVRLQKRQVALDVLRARQDPDPPATPPEE